MGVKVCLNINVQFCIVFTLLVFKVCLKINVQFCIVFMLRMFKVCLKINVQLCIIFTLFFDDILKQWAGNVVI